MQRQAQSVPAERADPIGERRRLNSPGQGPNGT